MLLTTYNRNSYNLLNTYPKFRISWHWMFSFNLKYASEAMWNIITWSLLLFGNPLPLFAALTTVMVSNTDRELLSKNFFNDLTNSKEVGTNWPLFGGKKDFFFLCSKRQRQFLWNNQHINIAPQGRLGKIFYFITCLWLVNCI